METSLSELITLLCSELEKGALEAQRGQLVQISDFVQSLGSSDEEFAARHVAPGDARSHSVRRWGFDLFDEGMSVEQHYDRLIAADCGLAPPAAGGKAARTGKAQLVAAMREQTMASLVGQRRSLLRSILERDEMPRLQIDSGELSLRLDLSVAQGRRPQPEMERLLSSAGMKPATGNGPSAETKEQDPRLRSNGIEVVAAVVAGATAASGNEACLTIRFKTL